MAKIHTTQSDLTGKRFGRLLVVRQAESKRAPCGTVSKRWFCICDCGTEIVAYQGNLIKPRNTKSCGCLRRDISSTIRKTHGYSVGSGHPVYNIWCHMRERCNNSTNKRYPNYGGRGIKICERWSNDFMAFFEDMGPRPTSQHSVDRIDVNGDYEPGNCRWATSEEQNNNRRDNTFYSFRGETYTLSKWARILNVPFALIRKRVETGWPIEEAFTLPSGAKRARQ